MEVAESLVSIPFRIELMGEPGHEYPMLVHDLGEHDKPFCRHTMRYGVIPPEWRDVMLMLWNKATQWNQTIIRLRGELSAAKEGESAVPDAVATMEKSKGKRR